MFTGEWLRGGLSSRNGFVRKGCAAALAVPKWIHAKRAMHEDFITSPPVLANSFPKSGTHLLAQIVDGLPAGVNYGAFLSSQTSSFQFRERTVQNTCRFIRGFAPGEIVRGHLYYEPLYAQELARRNVVNYFIYRDLRAVAVSEAHYLREMNRWHRLSPYFRKLDSMEEAIALSIAGFESPIPGINYPNIVQRFARYEGWLTCPDCFSIRFEDLQSDERESIVRKMAEFYRARCGDQDLDVDVCVRAMLAHVAPKKSHTFRSGKQSGWRKEFTSEHRQLFKEVAGDLLIELRYEHDHF